MKSFKDYANSFQAVSNLKLEGVRLLAEKTGNPQKNVKFIHVAGTNGKGSVCAFLQSILTEAGLRTGKFISPNMLDVCERISVDGNNIENGEMDRLMARLQGASQQVFDETGKLPTQFEIWTIAAFLYYDMKKCDVAVIETGLGGRLDATNIIEKPIFSLITRIDMDHMEYLGDTVEKIALEKAGIIKENCPVITARQQPNVLAVLDKAATQRKSRFTITEETKNNRHDGFTEIFDYKHIKDIRSGLAGLHQTENAALAAECALQLGISEEYIKNGIEKAKNPGRLELVSQKPTVIFDGAHNGSGAEMLISAVKRYFPGKRAAFIYAAMADKDLSPVFECFKSSGFGECDIYTVQVENNPRAETAQRLAERFSAAGFKAFPCQSFGEAYKKAVSENAVTVVCGSLYLYKDMIMALECER